MPAGGAWVRDGTWKPVTDIWVRDGGSWKAITNASVRDGTWKEFFAPDKCVDAPVITFVDEGMSVGSCPGGHLATVTITTTGELQSEQLYEYQIKIDGGSWFTHSRTTSKSRTDPSDCGDDPFGPCSQTFQWRCRVVENVAPWTACTSYVTSGTQGIDGSTC